MTLRKRRAIAIIVVFFASVAMLLVNPEMWETKVELPSFTSEETTDTPAGSPLEMLYALQVKGRAPKTGYSREQFGGDWANKAGCDTRNIILHRDLEADVVGDGCKVLRGTLSDPYTGKTIQFTRGTTTSDDVQIDHVVAVSNAWQTGAQQLNHKQRVAFYNDPLNLLAVDGAANQQKGDGDAATWLPKNKSFRCYYVARQIAVKKKHDLWVAPAEKAAMERALSKCV